MSGKKKPPPTNWQGPHEDRRIARFGVWATILVGFLAAFATVAAALIPQLNFWKADATDLAPVLEQRYSEGDEMIAKRRRELAGSSLPDKEDKLKKLDEIEAEWKRLTAKSLAAAKNGDEIPVHDLSKQLLELLNTKDAEETFGTFWQSEMKSKACELPPGVIDEPADLLKPKAA